MENHLPHRTLPHILAINYTNTKDFIALICTKQEPHLIRITNRNKTPTINLKEWTKNCTTIDLNHPNSIEQPHQEIEKEIKARLK